MKALVLQKHGTLDDLKVVSDYPVPQAVEGHVVIRVRASSFNYHDVFTVKGMPGIKVPMPAIMGLDVAGEIAEVGPGVTGWKKGDRVLVDPINRVEGGLMGETVHGGLAELCRARAHQLVRIPDGVSFSDAAALPVAYGTALRMMVTNGHIQKGEKVLILGASGGVGVCCLQLAKAAGCEVIACAGTDAKAKRLQELGADKTINYVEKDFMKEVYAMYGKPTRRGGGTNLDPGFAAIKRLKKFRVYKNVTEGLNLFQQGEIDAALRGSIVTAAGRHGKFLWLETDNGHELGLHLGMGGSIRASARRAKRCSCPMAAPPT